MRSSKVSIIRLHMEYISGSGSWHMDSGARGDQSGYSWSHSPTSAMEYLPSKFPPAFGINLRIADSQEVAMEGQWLSSECC